MTIKTENVDLDFITRENSKVPMSKYSKGQIVMMKFKNNTTLELNGECDIPVIVTDVYESEDGGPPLMNIAFPLSGGMGLIEIKELCLWRYDSNKNLSNGIESPVTIDVFDMYVNAVKDSEKGDILYDLDPHYISKVHPVEDGGMAEYTYA